jgi:hypothetical protein
MRSTIQTAIDTLAAQRGVADLAARAEAINRHHIAATKRANQAIEHARAAGTLLLAIRATLPRAEFVQWCRENVKVSVKQAKYYMAGELRIIFETPCRAILPGPASSVARTQRTAHYAMEPVNRKIGGRL